MRENAKKFGLVSVIMPSYNSEHFIAESIKSVQSQTYGDWELLIVDDCSKDGTIAVAEAIAKDDPRIHVFSNEHNSGAACSRNHALREAKGDWVAFLDSDDQWTIHKLRRQMAFLNAKQAEFAFTGSAFLDETGQRYRGTLAVPETVSV